MNVSTPPSEARIMWIIERKGDDLYGSVVWVVQFSLIRSEIVPFSLIQATRQGEEYIDPRAWTLRNNLVNEDVRVVVTVMEKRL